ncbi:pyridine nucleotide-disulfide oxidoreductase-domain-containing protein [Dactylonectria estremocensis]|uniref:Pyridine nucleotide-disulfide oxidoreductase-domain-containing protein n=1 Tax=Dactylonectria estremocensis TaxID=1079267 RepID=A0A9P9J3I4_9HYPO|nr:pyridine nucleotide-disulfide oxidoreductase-domain-containing protein [Dactylonectria estremocensis]
MLRAARGIPKHRFVNSIVVGGGPCGLAVVGNLLEQRPNGRQLWVDPVFKAGRVGDRYREVPSNTKVELFDNFATALTPFRKILAVAQKPNAITALESLPQDQGCELGYAADMCLMLTDGVAQHFDNVQQHRGKVTAAVYDESAKLWTAFLDGKDLVKTPLLVLCTGASPIENPLPAVEKLQQTLEMVHLDVALKPSELTKKIQPDATVAVVGASHSAILVLMNLYNMAAGTHPNLRIKWFTRHKDLSYAKYMDGWILRDNTGLKGQAAQWARENLEGEAFANSPVSKVMTKLWTPRGEEDQIYRTELPSCTHIIQAIGYKRNPLPNLAVAESADTRAEPLEIHHDDLTGRFFSSPPTSSSSNGRQYVPGLFGAGIAFPERVTDPLGNVEHAVGFWKFMRFLRQTVPQWVDQPKTA